METLQAAASELFRRFNEVAGSSQVSTHPTAHSVQLLKPTSLGQLRQQVPSSQSSGGLLHSILHAVLMRGADACSCRPVLMAGVWCLLAKAHNNIQLGMARYKECETCACRRVKAQACQWQRAIQRVPLWALVRGCPRWPAAPQQPPAASWKPCVRPAALQPPLASQIPLPGSSRSCRCPCSPQLSSSLRSKGHPALEVAPLCLMAIE